MTGNTVAMELAQRQEPRHPGESREPVLQRVTLNHTQHLDWFCFWPLLLVLCGRARWARGGQIVE